MRYKAVGFFLIFIIAIVILLGQNLINNISGCTKELQSGFEKSEVSKIYVDQYIKQLRSEGRQVTSGYWSISTRNGGCVVQYHVNYGQIIYNGDEFLIDPKTKMVYPHSDGSKLLMNYVGGSFQLNTSPSISSNSPLVITKTPIVYPTDTPYTYFVTPNVTPKTTCTSWSDVNLQDVGKNMCVYGYVDNEFSKDHVYYLGFGRKDGDFYMLSYDFVFPDVKRGSCVKATGKIEKLGINPVMAITPKIKLYNCS